MSQLKNPILHGPNGQIVESDRVMALKDWAQFLESNPASRVLFAGMGRPTFPIDQSFAESMQASWSSILENRTAVEYAHPAGDEDSRAIMARALTRLYKLNDRPITNNHVIFTAGGSSALASIFKAINAIKPNGLMITPSLHYPLHQGSDGRNKLYPINVLKLPGYRLTAKALSKTITSAKKKAESDKVEISAFIFCSPNNPTGVVHTEEEWLEIAEVLLSDDTLKSVPIILDESYAEMCMSKTHSSLLTLSPALENRIILLRSATKGFSAAGVRIATVVCKDTALLEKIRGPHTNFIGHADRIACKAYALAMDAFDDRAQSGIQRYYEPIVRRVEEGLRDIGAALPDPSYRVEGAFYVLANLNDLIGTKMCADANRALPDVTHILNDECLIYHLLFDQKIMIAPLSYFGAHSKMGYVRITCSHLGDCSEILRRLENCLITARKEKCLKLIETIKKQLAYYNNNHTPEDAEFLTEQLKTHEENFNRVTEAKNLKDLFEELSDLSYEIGEREKWRRLVKGQVTKLLRYYPVFSEDYVTKLKINRVSVKALEGFTDKLIILYLKLEESIHNCDHPKWKRLINILLSNLAKQITALMGVDLDRIEECLARFKSNRVCSIEEIDLTDELVDLYDALEEIMEEWELLKWKRLINIQLYYLSEHNSKLAAFMKNEVVDFFESKARNGNFNEIIQLIKEGCFGMIKTHLPHKAEELYNEIAKIPGYPVEIGVLGKRLCARIGGYLSQRDCGAARAASRQFYDMFTPLWDETIEKRSIISAIATGSDHSILLTEAAEAYVSGSNENGKIGLGLFKGKQLTWSRIPVENIRIVAAGSGCSMLLRTSGELYGCGANSYGELGLGHLNSQRTWVKLTRISNISVVSCSRTLSLFATTNGDLYGAGSNRSGVFGKNLQGTEPSWVKIDDMQNVCAVVARNFFCIVLIRSGAVFGRGFNERFQLGPQANNLRFVDGWLELCPGIKFSKIAAGDHHTLLISDKGLMYKFSYYYERWDCIPRYGFYSKISDISDIVAASDFSILRTQKGVFINLARYSTPYYLMEIPDFDPDHWYTLDPRTTIRSIAASDSYGFLLTENRELWGCGVNSMGQLALNHCDYQSNPVKIQFDAYPLSQGFFSKRTITFNELLRQRNIIFNVTHLNTLLNRCEELAEKLDDEFDPAKCRQYLSTMKVDYIGHSLSESFLEPWKAKFKLLTLDAFKGFYRDLHRELNPDEELQFSSSLSTSPSTKG